MYEVSVTRRNVMDPECKLPLSRDSSLNERQRRRQSGCEGLTVIRLTVASVSNVSLMSGSVPQALPWVSPGQHCKASFLIHR